MTSTGSMRSLYSHLFTMLIVFGGLVGNAAGVDLFGRYFRNQPRESVLVEPTRLLGSLQDGKLQLSERQAIEMALQNNLDINLERHAPLISTWNIQELRGAFDPIALFNWNWDRETTPTASVLQGGTSVTNVLTAYSFNYRQPFATGTSLEANFNTTRNRTTNFFSSLVPGFNSNFEVLVRQNLLEGFGRTAPDYQIEIAANNRQISEQEFKRRVAEIILQVQDRYWELQHALQDIRLREKTLQLATTIMEQNRSRFEVGTAARLEVVQGEAEVALRREELIRSRFNFRRIQDQLIKLISNYDDPRRFPGEIVPTDPLHPPPALSQTFEQLQAVSAELRPEMQQAELEAANQQVNLDLSRNRLRPTLDLVAGYQQFGLGGNQVVRDFSRGFINPPILSITPGGLGDALEQLFSGDFYGYVLGFSFQLPIFNTEARAENAAAQIALDRAELRKRAVQQNISLEIRDALTQVEMNIARIDAASAAVDFASQRLEGEQARFEVGMGTTRELIETQRDLEQAESLLVRAQTDLIKSHALLDKAVGRSLERYNIRLEEALRINVR
ncbi:MAG: TolC family protein [Acidobacteria bacterium]|nr:TolC family protein [Acidobacteriota bacterium]